MLSHDIIPCAREAADKARCSLKGSAGGFTDLCNEEVIMDVFGRDKVGAFFCSAKDTDGEVEAVARRVLVGRMNDGLDNLVLGAVVLPASEHCEARDVAVDLDTTHAIVIGEHVRTGHDELDVLALDIPVEDEARSAGARPGGRIDHHKDECSVGNTCGQRSLIEVDSTSVIAGGFSAKDTRITNSGSNRLDGAGGTHFSGVILVLDEALVIIDEAVTVVLAFPRSATTAEAAASASLIGVLIVIITAFEVINSGVLLTVFAGTRSHVFKQVKTKLIIILTKFWA